MDDEALAEVLDYAANVPKVRVPATVSRQQLAQGFLAAFELTGGVSRLTQWAADPDNYESFLKLCTKLFPQNVQIEGVQTVQFLMPVAPTKLDQVGLHQGNVIQLPPPHVERVVQGTVIAPDE